MRRALMLPVALVATLALTACPGPKGPVRVEILDYDPGAAEWRLATSTLDTVTDLNVLTGEWFDVVGNQQVTQDMLAYRQLDPSSVTLQQLRDMTFERRGEPVQLSYDLVTDASGAQVAVANDFESLAMMTVFHHFEKVWRFARDVTGDRTAATGEASLVGFYATVASRVGISIPVLSADNAAFVPMTDSFVVLRIQLIDGIPFALNPGVIAHEFSHRLFFHNVFARSAFSSWFDKTILASQAETQDDADVRAGVLLKSLDEGCADVHALAFSGRTQFIADSIQGDNGEATRLQRDVEGAFADWATYETLQSGEIFQGSSTDLCSVNSESFHNTSWNYYCLGTVWARALWDTAGRDAGVLRTELAPALYRALGRLGEEKLATTWSFDFDLILELLAQEVQATAPARLGALCSAFQDKFSTLMFQVPTCP